MIDEELNEIEIAPASVVKQAIRDFAEALAETSEFSTFETAADRLRRDAAAQTAMQAFQAKQQDLQMMLMLNAVSPEDQAELERLRQAFLLEPSVAAYFQAQAELVALCQGAAGIISQSTGSNYSAACGVSCCG